MTSTPQIPLHYQVRVQEIMLDELKQTTPKQAIYQQLGGNVFIPISRDSALSACEQKLKTLQKELQKN